MYASSSPLPAGQTSRPSVVLAGRSLAHLTLQTDDAVAAVEDAIGWAQRPLLSELLALEGELFHFQADELVALKEVRHLRDALEGDLNGALDIVAPVFALYIATVVPGLDVLSTTFGFDRVSIAAMRHLRDCRRR